MPRSSIFSFESLRSVRPRRPVTLLGIGAVLCLLEFGLRGAPQSWFADVNPTGEWARLEFMERKVLPRCDNPQIIVLGSSRAAFAIAPRLLDRQLGLPANATLNAGLIAGTPPQILEFYRHHRAKLGRARLAVVNIDECFLNTGFMDLPAVLEQAPFSEWWGMQRRMRFRPLLEKTLTMKTRLPALHDNVLNRLGWPPPGRLHLQVDNDGKLWFDCWADAPQNKSPAALHSVLQGYYENFALLPVSEGPLIELTRLLQEDQVRVVFAQMPNLPAYQREVMTLYGEEYRQHLSHMRQLAERLKVPFYHFDDAARCGLTADSYYDMIHLRPAGAQDFTRFVADLIRKENLLRPAESAFAGQ
jgi:hypothetical protein